MKEKRYLAHPLPALFQFQHYIASFELPLYMREKMLARKLDECILYSVYTEFPLHCIALHHLENFVAKGYIIVYRLYKKSCPFFIFHSLHTNDQDFLNILLNSQ